MVVKGRGIRSCYKSDAYLPITSCSVYGWRRMTRITDMHGDLKAESSGWLFKLPLAGGGAYCGGPIQATQLVSLVTSLIAVVGGQRLVAESQAKEATT